MHERIAVISLALSGYRSLWIVLGLGFLLRVVYVFEIDESPLFFYPAVDSETYVHQAERIADGNWLYSGQGPFWQPPFYPYFLGILKALFPASFFHIVRLVQALLGALVCGFTWWIGRHVFSEAVGFIAGISVALCGTLIFFDGELLPASLATFFNMGSLAALLNAWRKPAGGRFLVCGMMFGIASIVVPSVLLFAALIPIGLLWKFPSRQRWTYTAVFLVGMALSIGPVAVRNHIVGGDSVLISYNGGINFYIGNNADYERTVAIGPGWEWDELVTQPTRSGITLPSEKSAYFMRRGWDYIAGDTMAWTALMVDKFALFWHGDEIGRNQPIYFWRTYSTVLSATLWKAGIAFPYGLIAPLAIWGLLMSIRRCGLTWPAVYVLSYSLAVTLFFVAARYRMPALPVLVVFAAYGGWIICEAVRARDWRTTYVGLGVCAAFVLLVNRSMSPMDMDGDAAIHYNLGNAHAKSGNRQAAHVSFAKAVEKNPQHHQALLNLGSVKGSLGDVRGAGEIFSRLSREVPGQVEPWVNLAHVRVMQRDVNGAFAAYEEALALNPKLLSVYVEMITLYGQLGDLAQAAQVLKRSIDQIPDERDRLRKLYDGVQMRVLSQGRDEPGMRR